MNIIIYILSWKKVTLNSLEIHKNISKIHDNVFIINCDENFISKENHIINCDDSYYFTKQIYKCIEHCVKYFPNFYIMTITGDISHVANWKNILQRCMYGFENLNAGVIAPNVDYTAWNTRCKKNIDNFWIVENTDCTVWCLHPLVYEFLLIFDIRNINKYGWGIDWILIDFAKKLGFNILRDYNNNIKHPKSTGYESKEAKNEFKKLKDLYHKIYNQ